VGSKIDRCRLNINQDVIPLRNQQYWMRRHSFMFNGFCQIGTRADSRPSPEMERVGHQEMGHRVRGTEIVLPLTRRFAAPSPFSQERDLPETFPASISSETPEGSTHIGT
jgi:hypothetical protein